MGLYGIGQPVPREEDPKLLRGQGRYVDDVRMPGEARAFVLRSPHAHAAITAIDVRRAKQMPGVLAVLTGDDLRARGLATLRPHVPRKRSTGAPAFVAPQPLLAQGRVRCAGEAVAFVVAETLDIARDAAEAIEVTYEPLPTLDERHRRDRVGRARDLDRQSRQRGVLSRDGRQGRGRCGDEKRGACRAPHYRHQPRHCQLDGAARLRRLLGRRRRALHDPLHHPVGPRHARGLAGIFKAPHHKFRVLCDNMGGGFGMKGGCYPEYGLSLWASEVVGRPVRWIGERSEGLLSDEQSRGSVVETELALDKDMKFLALRAHWKAAIGAYYSSDRCTIPLTVALGCLVNTYTIPAIHAQVHAVFTNTMMIAPYRGGGRPEPLFVTEIIVDKAARELGIDPAELRRRNTIPARAMPYTTPARQTYDSGDFAQESRGRTRARQIPRSSPRAAPRRKSAARFWASASRLRSPALAGAISSMRKSASIPRDRSPSSPAAWITAKVTARPSSRFSRRSSASIPSASAIAMATPISSPTASARSARARRCWRARPSSSPPTAHRARQEDRGAYHGGVGRRRRVRERRLRDRRHRPQGRARRGGAPRLRFGHLPRDMEAGFSERSDYGPPNSATFPSGAHIAEIEIDAETGKAALVRYAAVDDVGRMLNPLLCDGQIQGGIAQGIGQALSRRWSTSRSRASS